MNSQGQTAGFLRFHAAYHRRRQDSNLARLGHMGLEPTQEAAWKRRKPAV